MQVSFFLTKKSIEVYYMSFALLIIYTMNLERHEVQEQDLTKESLVKLSWIIEQIWDYENIQKRITTYQQYLNSSNDLTKTIELIKTNKQLCDYLQNTYKDTPLPPHLQNISPQDPRYEDSLLLFLVQQDLLQNNYFLYQVRSNSVAWVIVQIEKQTETVSDNSFLKKIWNWLSQIEVFEFNDSRLWAARTQWWRVYLNKAKIQDDALYRKNIYDTQESDFKKSVIANETLHILNQKHNPNQKIQYQQQSYNGVHIQEFISDAASLEHAPLVTLHQRMEWFLYTTIHQQQQQAVINLYKNAYGNEYTKHSFHDRLPQNFNPWYKASYDIIYEEIRKVATKEKLPAFWELLKQINIIIGQQAKLVSSETYVKCVRGLATQAELQSVKQKWEEYDSSLQLAISTFLKSLSKTQTQEIVTNIQNTALQLHQKTKID